MAERFNQMSEQAALIARKKAEIEAKKIAGSVDGSSKTNQPSSSSGSSTKASPLVGNSKNRWGFKGKVAVGHKPPVASPSTQTKPAVVNNFMNDGSFLEQFKKLQETKKTTEPDVVKPEAVVREENRKEEKVPEESVTKPPEADDWYKSALEKARAIAQTIKPPQSSQETTSKVKTEPVKQEEESEYGPSTSAGPSAVKVEPSSTDNRSEGNFMDIIKQEGDYDDESLEPLPLVAQELASMVALSGDQLEDIARARNVGEEELAFLQDKECDMYKRYRLSVESMRKGMDAERIRNKEDRKERKKSRWSDEKVETVPQFPVHVTPQQTSTIPPGTSPQLVQYALRVFGSTDLTNDQWRQCEDQIKMSVVYNEMLAKKKATETLVQQGKRKYEYDSDEDVEGGTWEHKARRNEMEKTAREAIKLTEAAKGKHHIGDFLPPEELTKFMSKYQALKRGEDYDESDYADNKLTNDNLGFKMLQKMGWTEGKGLGSEAQGITAPIQKGNVNSDKKGLGVNVPHELSREDDEFEAYRKRMMLAYRFRPNPLNNPRRAYY